MKKITIQSTTLLKAIQLVAPVVKDRSVIPIYDNLLFDIVDGKLKITAANMEIRANTSIDIDASGNFGFCVEKKMMVNMLNGLSHYEIEIHLDKNKISIHSKAGVYNLPIEPAKDYPTAEVISDMKSFMLDADFFLGSLKKAAPFVDENHFQPSLTGVLIKSLENELYVVGGTGRLMYERKFPYNGEEVKMCISPSAARYISSSFSADEPLIISYNKTFFCVSCMDFSVEITQMNIDYPDYKKVVDSIKQKSCLKIPKLALLESINRFHSISEKGNNSLVMELKDNKLSMYLENTAKAYTGLEQLDCIYQDEPLKIGFDVNYIKTAISAIEDSNIEWYFMSPTQPSIFIESNKEDKTRLVVCPIKIS